MAVRFQLVINCADPDRMARFWADALGYELEPPPPGFADWDDWRRDMGLLGTVGVGADSIIDPDGSGPRIWFQVVPDGKTVPNRLHVDIHASGGPAVPYTIRRERMVAVARRLCDLGASMIDPGAWKDDDATTGPYAVAMRDPEGNEFDIN
ncbi:MAG TPA: VOC family protein [Trebonia sp.]|jgi:catechol 2,3-dioxygenase-like lactoylglutathione lyase family enzyme|nr:VOC family protein [Trebonia sp.]